MVSTSTSMCFFCKDNCHLSGGWSPPHFVSPKFRKWFRNWGILSLVYTILYHHDPIKLCHPHRAAARSRIQRNRATKASQYPQAHGRSWCLSGKLTDQTARCFCCKERRAMFTNRNRNIYYLYIYRGKQNNMGFFGCTVIVIPVFAAKRMTVLLTTPPL